MCFTGKSHTYRNNLKITATAARERQRRTTGGHPPNRHAVQATRAAGGNRLPRGTPLGATPAAAAQRPPVRTRRVSAAQQPHVASAGPTDTG